MKKILFNVIALFSASVIFLAAGVFSAGRILKAQTPNTVVTDNYNKFISSNIISEELLSLSSTPSSVPLSSEATSSSVAASKPSKPAASKPPVKIDVDVDEDKPINNDDSGLGDIIDKLPDKPVSTPSKPPITSSEIIPDKFCESEEYIEKIAGTVQNEMIGTPGANPLQGTEEAIKAQAIATHCFVKSNGDSFTGTSYKKPSARTIELCKMVINQLLYYNGKVAKTFYFASAGGQTLSNNYCWSASPIPYLQTKKSDDELLKTFTVSIDETKELIEKKLASDKLSIPENPADWFDLKNATKVDGGWVYQMNVCGVSTTGRFIREQMFGGTKLKSTKITKIEVVGNNFVFTTNGYGHGVGMSQLGAMNYSRAGQSYKQILAHYYPGTTLTTFGG